MQFHWNANGLRPPSHAAHKCVCAILCWKMFKSSAGPLMWLTGRRHRRNIIGRIDFGRDTCVHWPLPSWIKVLIELQSAPQMVEREDTKNSPERRPTMHWNWKNHFQPNRNHFNWRILNFVIHHDFPLAAHNRNESFMPSHYAIVWLVSSFFYPRSVPCIASPLPSSYNKARKIEENSWNFSRTLWRVVAIEIVSCFWSNWK